MGKKTIILDIDVKDGRVGLDALDKALEGIKSELIQTEAQIRKVIKVLKDKKKELLIGSEAYEKITQEISEYEAALKSSTSAVNKETNAIKADTGAKNKNASANQNMINKTGLASATVVELGRTISDLNYGLPAVANNLSQLSTLMTTLVATTGGLRQGIAQLWKVMRSPVGVIVVFQAIIAIMEKFALSSRKSKEETDSLAKAIGSKGGLISELTLLGDIMEESLESSVEYQNALSQLKKKGFDPATQSVEDFIEAQIRLLKLQASRGFYEKEIQKIQEELIPLRQELAKQAEEARKTELEALNAINAGERGNAVAIANSISARSDYNDSLEKSGELMKKQNDLEKEYKEILKQVREELGSISNTPEFDLTDEITQARVDIDSMLASSAQERLIIQNEAAKAELDLALKIYKEKIDLDTKLTEQQKSLLISQAEEQTRTLRGLINEQTQIGIRDIWLGDSTKIIKDVKAAGRDVETALEGALEGTEPNADNILDRVIGNEEEVKEAARKRAEAIVSQFKSESLMEEIGAWADTFSNVFSFVDSEFNRQLDAQRAFATEQNNILKEQLNNENLSAEERKRIQLKISQNDEASRKEQEKIRKKQFKANKAFGIAQATTNTFLAATQVLKDDTLPSALKIPTAAATITFGLAQVATIARQKYVPTAASAPSAGALGGSGGSGDRTFDFNLVGESPESQLNRTNQSQFEKPLQAYVVSKDISSQQELDLNIRKSAKI